MLETLTALYVVLNLLKTTLIAQAQQMPVLSNSAITGTIISQSQDIAPIPQTPQITPEFLEIPTIGSEFSNRAIPLLIQCETQGHNISIIDVNGTSSKGILMYQQNTWDEFSRESGITGSPMQPSVAIQMTHWALTTNPNNIHRWENCAKKQGLL